MFIVRAKQQYMTIDKEHTCHNKCQMMIVIYTLKMKYKTPHCMANVILAQDVNIRRKYFSSSKLICYFLKCKYQKSQRPSIFRYYVQCKKKRSLYYSLKHFMSYFSFYLVTLLLTKPFQQVLLYSREVNCQTR